MNVVLHPLMNVVLKNKQPKTQVKDHWKADKTPLKHPLNTLLTSSKSPRNPIECPKEHTCKTIETDLKHI